jgi:hypothetical protein
MTAELMEKVPSPSVITATPVFFDLMVTLSIALKSLLMTVPL